MINKQNWAAAAIVLHMSLQLDCSRWLPQPRVSNPSHNCQPAWPTIKLAWSLPGLSQQTTWLTGTVAEDLTLHSVSR
jgi:hypothetical protein